MKVINAFSNAFVHAKKEPKHQLRRAASRRRRMTDRGTAQLGFFRGSELPRLLVLAAVMVVGWVAGLELRPEAARAGRARPLAVTGKPEPVVADRSTEFETVTDRTPIEFRDNAAYSLLLERARGQIGRRAGRGEPPRHPPAPPLAEPRALPRRADPPARHRPAGAPLSVEAEPDRLALRGLDHHARRDAGSRIVCVFEDAPTGLPIGPNVSERVVFNGYFLKIMKYQASDVARGAPVLVGRIGWDAAVSRPAGAGAIPPLSWSLIVHRRDVL